MEAIETLLGGKKFLMGDQICNEDASIFATIAQVINHDRGPFNDYYKSKPKTTSSIKPNQINWFEGYLGNSYSIWTFLESCPNMKRYYETMKDLYWPDWDENIREKKSEIKSVKAA